MFRPPQAIIKQLQREVYKDTTVHISTNRFTYLSRHFTQLLALLTFYIFNFLCLCIHMWVVGFFFCGATAQIGPRPPYC